MLMRRIRQRLGPAALSSPLRRDVELRTPAVGDGEEQNAASSVHARLSLSAHHDAVNLCRSWLARGGRRGAGQFELISERHPAFKTGITAVS